MLRRKALTVLAVTAAGCSRWKEEDEQLIRVGVAPYLSMSSLHLGWERGYFREAGLGVDLVASPNSTEAIPLLAGGKLDVAFFSPGPALFNAVLRGARVAVVAGRERLTPDCGTVGDIYTRREAFPNGLAGFEQLRGKKLAITHKTTVSAFFLDEILRHAGLRTTDVEVPLLRRAEALAALLGGRIDATLSDGHFDKDPARGDPRVIAVKGAIRVLPGFQYSHIMFGSALLDGDPRRGTAFLTAYHRAAEAFQNGATPKFMDDFALSNNLDPKHTREFCRTTFSPDGAIDETSLQRFINWSVEKGFCPQAVDLKRLIDRRFLPAGAWAGAAPRGTL